MLIHPTHPTHPSHPTTPRRPRLALVIGSGGVRSVAALGAVEVLAREGLRPDVVVGCGSGALFAATIALRVLPEHALQIATELWSRGSTRGDRWRAWLQVVVPRLAGSDEDFALRDAEPIERRIRDAFGQRRIENAPTALRLGATDAGTGEPVVLTRGSLVDALRASLSVPLLFPPVTIGGRRLVDGTISDPLPLSAASDARAVVALGSRCAMPARVERASRILAHVNTVLINNLMQARSAAARAAGQRVAHLEPALERQVGQWETGALRDLYEAGRRATQAQLPRIIAMVEGRAMRAAA